MLSTCPDITLVASLHYTHDNSEAATRWDNMHAMNENQCYCCNCQQYIKYQHFYHQHRKVWPATM